MKILNLELSNFRNYEKLKFNPSENINLIIGKNAMGKTNLLEAIYTISLGKSFKTNRDDEVLKLGSSKSKLKASILNFDYLDEVSIEINKMGKNKYFLNDEELSLREFRRDFSSVIFSPSDLNMIKLSPGERRKYLDILISKINPMYDYNLSMYKKILFQRNKFLKKDVNYDLLKVYNFQLASYGVKILKERLKIIKNFEKYTKLHFKNLSGGGELRIIYLSTIPFNSEEKEMEELFNEYLKKFHLRDIEKRFTTIGPHRDDLDFQINKLSAKTYGSQGEMRTVILALKLGEIDLIREHKKNNPLLLLDDVFSELDKYRTEYLMNSIKDVQTFITSTDNVIEDLKNLKGNLYEVQDGEIFNIRLGEI